VLEFHNVAVEPQPPYDAGLEQTTFSLGPGELALVRVDEGAPHTPLGDVAQGLVGLSDGKVLFEGRNWSGLNGDELVAARARTGRVFEGAGWVSNLDVDENIQLAQMCHTQRTPDEIQADIMELAKAFEMDELPRIRPAVTPRTVLRRAQWVRAFLSQPMMLVLERPTREMPDAWSDVLLKQVRASRARGAAVLWITDERYEWTHDGIKPTLKFEIHGPKMVPVTLTADPRHPTPGT
jgi:ABC-type ATPase involved in cell division